MIDLEHLKTAKAVEPSDTEVFDIQVNHELTKYIQYPWCPPEDRRTVIGVSDEARVVYSELYDKHMSTQPGTKSLMKNRHVGLREQAVLASGVVAEIDKALAFEKALATLSREYLAAPHPSDSDCPDDISKFSSLAMAMGMTATTGQVLTTGTNGTMGWKDPEPVQDTNMRPEDSKFFSAADECYIKTDAVLAIAEKNLQAYKEQSDEDFLVRAEMARKLESW